jgi:alkylglycerol monooxygenase
MNPTSASLGVLLFMASCVFAEMAYSRYSGKNLYQSSETYVNFACGIIERLFDVALFVALYGIFTTIYEHQYTLFHISEPLSPWLFLPLLLAADMGWYWYHRMSHEVNFLWAIHVVHHQSEDYNLSIFFRATALQNIVRTTFWIPVGFIGFPPKACFLAFGILGLYQFFMHNQWIRRLRGFEDWVATPAHHRVHHSSNGGYLDKNYAALFSFYDRLFGTYEVETEAPIYGVTNPYKRTNILGVYFDHFKDIFRAFKAEKGAKERREILFGPPAKMPDSVKRNLRAEVKTDPGAGRIIVATLLLNAALILLILANVVTLSWKILLALLIPLSIILVGVYLERRTPQQVEAEGKNIESITN